MMRALVAIGILSNFGFAPMQVSEGWNPGDPAPKFEAKGSDGKVHTLAEYTKNGAVLLYFIKPVCPVNAGAVPYFNRLVEPYKKAMSKVTFVGVYGGPEESYPIWQEQSKAPYPVLFDADKKIIADYHAMRSPWVILVDREGKIQKEWIGYSVAQLEEMSAALARLAGVPEAKTDFKGAPSEPRSGCSF